MILYTSELDDSDCKCYRANTRKVIADMTNEFAINEGQAVIQLEASDIDHPIILKEKGYETWSE